MFCFISLYLQQVMGYSAIHTGIAHLPLAAGIIVAAGGTSALVTKLGFVPVTIAAVTGIKPREAGLASGLINTSQRVGGALGLAILATIANRRTQSLMGAISPTAAAD